MIGEDAYIERIVAGINAVSMDGAKVEWNKNIDGRQFDVVINFRNGYVNILAVIEVKNKNRPVEAKDIESFIVKSRDRKANKIMFVSSSGFQSGAVAVAQKHDVSIFSVDFNCEKINIPSNLFSLSGNKIRRADSELDVKFSDDEVFGIHIENILINFSDGQSVSLPNESSEMRYYVSKTVNKNGISIENILDKYEFSHLAVGMKKNYSIELSEFGVFTPPDEIRFKCERISSIDITASGAMKKMIYGNFIFEQGAISHPVKYTDCVSGAVAEFDVTQLPIGESNFSTDTFYVKMHPLTYYYCRRVEGDRCEMIQIQSFQAGNLVQAKYITSVSRSKYYVKVMDRGLIKVLKRRYNDFLKKHE